jgi:hypothetical protein
MKKTSFLILFGTLATAFILLSTAADSRTAKNQPDQKPAWAANIDWEIPMAAGVWYPGSGPLPAKPMRYYRVRCFPGCHSGSRYGAFPGTPLTGDHPIFPTSTIDFLQNTHTAKKAPYKP